MLFYDRIGSNQKYKLHIPLKSDPPFLKNNSKN